MSSLANRTWSFPRKTLEELLAYTGVIWVLYLVAIVAIAYGIDRFGTVESSVWEPTSQVAPWFVLFVGARIGGTLFPLYVSHGKTRRDVFVESAIFLAIYSVITGTMVTIGALLERAIFSANDWPQTVKEQHLFSTAHDYPRIFVEFWVVFLAWTTAGMLIAAANYRFGATGLLTIAPCILIGGLLQALLSATWFPAANEINRIIEVDSTPILLAVLLGLAAFALLLTFAWYILRDLPLRTKSA